VFWAKGFCVKGSACVGAHDAALTSQNYCPYYLSEGGCKDAKCPKKHQRLPDALRLHTDCKKGAQCTNTLCPYRH